MDGETKKSHPPHADGLAQELGILSHSSMIAAIVQGQDGWFRVPNGLVEAMHLMPKSTVVTLLVLMRYADDQGQAWPSIATIGRLGGISKRSTVRALAWLERSGLIRRIRRRGPAEGNQSTIYQIQLPWYEQAPLVPPEHLPLCHQSTYPCATRAPTLVPPEHLPLCHQSTYPCATGAPGQRPNDKDLLTKKRARSPQSFVKPTLEEVAAYCKARGNTVDPEAFWAFYESNGWKVGRNPMKDWQAAVRTWERRPQYGNAQPAAKPKAKKDYLDDVLRSVVARTPK